MEKMTIDSAREKISSWESSPAFIMSGSKEHSYWKAKGFIECHDSREAEIHDLNKTIDDLSLKLRVALAEKLLEGLK